MKVIIAGTRTRDAYYDVVDAVNKSGMDITEVVTGCAAGIDKMGELWAIKNHVPYTRFPAEWEKYGKSAGPRRNKQMAKYADGLIAIWDGESPGTRNMINEAGKQRIQVFVYPLRG